MRLSICLLCILFLASCRFKVYKTSQATNADGTQVTQVGEGAPLNFTYLKENILKPKCMECHDGFSDAPDFSTYQQVMEYVVPNEPNESKLYRVLIHDKMPEKREPLPSVEKKYIYDWIKNGALNESK